MRKRTISNIFTLSIYIFLSIAVHFPIFHTCLIVDFYYIANKSANNESSEVTFTEGLSFRTQYSYQYCTACKWIADSKSNSQSQVISGFASIILSSEQKYFQQHPALYRDYNYLLRAPPIATV